jgi:hypothetical protein
MFCFYLDKRQLFLLSLRFNYMVPLWTKNICRRLNMIIFFRWKIYSSAALCCCFFFLFYLSKLSIYIHICGTNEKKNEKITRSFWVINETRTKAQKQISTVHNMLLNFLSSVNRRRKKSDITIRIYIDIFVRK